MMPEKNSTFGLPKFHIQVFGLPKLHIKVASAKVPQPGVDLINMAASA
jgi:hypothetical protein